MSKKEESKERNFDQVYAQMKKLEGEGKADEARALLRSFLEVTAPLADSPVLPPIGMISASKSANAGPKTTKIKLLRECLIDGEIHKVGSEHLVTDEVAKEFCDRRFKGYHPFYGYMPEIGPLMDEVMLGQPAMSGLLERKELVRAVRVQAKTA